MNDVDTTFSPGAEVVVLSGDPGLLAWEPGSPGAGGWTVTRVASPYEAAAELLAGEAVVLVMDLRAVSPRHAGLMDVARGRGVEMLAVGTVPAGLASEDLSGVRLMARADLADALASLAGGGQYKPAPRGRTKPPPAAAATDSSRPADHAEGGQYVPQPKERREKPKKEKPAGKTAGKKSKKSKRSKKSSRKSPRKTRKKASRSPGPGGGGPGGDVMLLTPEELAALLGDEP